ncbi:MAG: hypothetical protein ACRD9Y_04645 [Blastocatellia bacterium]
MALQARRKNRRRESESAETVSGRKEFETDFHPPRYFRPFRRPSNHHYSALTVVEADQQKCASQRDIEEDQEKGHGSFVPLELLFADNSHLTPPV